MARNMSFMLTTDQIRDQSKTVTRRLGWWTDKNGRTLLHRGDLLNACVKCMGLKAGEKIEKLCELRVDAITREPLSAMLIDSKYGACEAAKEGFPELSGAEFVAMFCEHMRCSEDTKVTRIKFEYVEKPAELFR